MEGGEDMDLKLLKSSELMVLDIVLPVYIEKLKQSGTGRPSPKENTMLKELQKEVKNLIKLNKTK